MKKASSSAVGAIHVEERTDGLTQVLNACRIKGVTLWVEDGRLRYRAGKGALGPEDIGAIARYRRELLSLLSTAKPLSIDIRPRRPGRFVPLAYSQLAHWHRYSLSERPHLRQIASATRLSGPLDLIALRRSLAKIVHRHEALRTHIVVVDHVPMQSVSESADYNLGLEDLTSLPDHLREDYVRSRIESYVAERTEVTRDALFGTLLLRLGLEEHVLIVAIEHMISDGISLNIVMRDLLTVYERGLQGEEGDLPELAVQFADYAAWQRDAQRSWIIENGAYWQQRLSACSEVRLTSGEGAPLPHGRRGWGFAPVAFSGELRGQLLEWCRLNGVTLPMTVCAAYAAVVLRWGDTQNTVIRYVTDGRIAPSLENVVGYFASLLFLRVELHDGLGLLDLVRSITEEYCLAQERSHLGYIEAQRPLPSFALGCGFNWVPERSGDSPAEGPARTLICSPVAFSHPMLRDMQDDISPFALFYERAGAITGGLYYPRDRYSDEGMIRFTRDFRDIVQTLVKRSDLKIANVTLS